MSIREDFSYILSNYIQSKNNRNMVNIRAVFKSLVNKTSELPVIKRNKNLMVTYGVGIGNIANIPWLAVLDKRITTSTQSGIYCVYLLKADMTGIYLTFNQGVGKTARGSPTKERLTQLHDTAVSLRSHLSWLKLQEFVLGDIQLSDKGLTGRAYETATIASKYYERGNVPSDTILVNDLTFLLDAYEQYVKTTLLLRKAYRKEDISSLPIISEETFSREKQIQEDEARVRTEEELEARIAEASQIPSVQQTISNRFVRNSDVAELTKKRAKGKCQLCKKDAPFNDVDGNPFLEIHHIIWLSNGGKDTLDNTVALCPNCHRKIHILGLEEDIVILRNK